MTRRDKANYYLDIAETVAERTRSQVVQVIGRKIILYKESKENKKIILP